MSITHTHMYAHSIQRMENRLPPSIGIVIGRITSATWDQVLIMLKYCFASFACPNLSLPNSKAGPEPCECCD